MIILLVDGQGGGIGKSIIEKLKPLLKAEHQIIAVGTNSIATANMIKAGRITPPQARTPLNITPKELI